MGYSSAQNVNCSPACQQSPREKRNQSLKNEKVKALVDLTNLFHQEKKNYHLPLLSLERLVNEGKRICADKLSWNSTALLQSEEEENLYQFSGSLLFVRLL